jgi:hypothetical protein
MIARVVATSILQTEFLCTIKHDIGDSENTTKYLFATAVIQNSKTTTCFGPFWWPSSGCIFIASRLCTICQLDGILYIILML